MNKISFSTDVGLKSEDVEESRRLAEVYFRTERDPEQMPTTKANRNWIVKHIPDYCNIIKANGRIIGFTLMFPSSIRSMNDFLEKKISEAVLFQKAKRSYRNAGALYLCSAFVKPEFRRQGLACRAFVKSIKKVAGRRKPILFYWAYTRAGDKLAQHVAKEFGIKILKRKD